MNSWIYDNGLDNDLVLFSCISVDRNYKDVLFTDKLLQEEAINNADVLWDFLKEEDPFRNFNYIRYWEMGEKYLRNLESKGISTKELRKRADRAALIENKDETKGIMINGINHLRIFSIENNLNLIERYEQLDEIDNHIEEKFKFAYHDEFGYLTATNEGVGTGLKIEVILHIPTLEKIGGLKKVKDELLESNIVLSEFTFHNGFKAENLYRLNNKSSLGENEESIIKKVEEKARWVIKEELSERDYILKEYKLEIEDRIYRAVGTLKNARLISFKELVTLNTVLRFASESKLLDLKIEDLNKLLVYGLDNMLELEAGKELTIREKNELRAKISKLIIE